MQGMAVMASTLQTGSCAGHIRLGDGAPLCLLVACRGRGLPGGVHPVRSETAIQESSASNETSDSLAPLGRPRRLFARLLDNLPWLVLFGWPPPLVPSPVLLLPGEVVALVYFSYHVFSYRAWGGHAGHLLFGGRVRDMGAGGRVTLRQAAVRSLYDLAPLPVAYLAGLFALLLLFAAGERLDPLVSSAMTSLGLEHPSELEHSFGSFYFMLALLAWMIEWFAVGCVAILMGAMVLRREDRRHAFDILARVIVVRNPATA